MDLTSPTPPQPTPNTYDDIIWNEPPAPRILVAAGRVQRGGTIAMTGRITPRAYATARATLPTVEAQLSSGKPNSRKRQVLTWRLQGARAALAAGGAR